MQLAPGEAGQCLVRLECRREPRCWPGITEKSAKTLELESGKSGVRPGKISGSPHLRGWRFA